MIWSSDTHDIVFDITENEIFVVKCAEKYQGIEVNTLYNMVVEENTIINQMDKTPEEISEIKEKIFTGQKTLADYVI